MPTPVGTARQCLTKESEQALDEAVAVARRRGHAQTTSLHMVSALLSLPSSALREACSRTRNNAYSTRIQLKALELCLSVSLDRLPSTPNRVEEPPVSNSLMAAIKRSQASQRRQPENIYFYQHQNQQQLLPSSSSSSSISVVKVELQNLILSILDDPVVSRVFGESGFRSCEIKIGIIRPVHQMFRYSRYTGSPVFLCNLGGDSELRRRGFSFPFMGFSGVLDGEENCRRIGEVMMRDNGRRNPLLLGACGYDALTTFLEMVQRRRGRNILPLQLSGLGVVCVENEILRFVSGKCEEGLLKLRFEEVDRMVENCVGPGVLVNFGDLMAMAGGDASVDVLRFVVCELAKLVEIHGGKVWLIGAAARYEIYLKFLNTFPSIEKDLDLQLLPITTLRLSMGESYPRSSLMESFVPFGGFFSSPSEMKISSSSLDQNIVCCNLCNEKCDEVPVLATGGLTTPVADHYPSRSSWLQMTDFTTHSGSDIVKAKDDRDLLSTKIAGLHRRWDNICQHHHHNQTLPKAKNSGQLGTQITPVVGFQVPKDGKINVKDDCSSPARTPSTQSDGKNINLSMSKNVQHFSTTKSSSPVSLLPKASEMNFLTRFRQSESPSKVIEDNALSSLFSSTSSNVRDGLTSPTSVTSLTVDLNLGISSSCASRELKKPVSNGCMGPQLNFSSCLSVNPDIIIRNISSNSIKSSSCSCPDNNCQVDQKDFKKLYSALAKRIGRQEEAVKVISHTIACCRTTNERHRGANRGDIWFNFVGPDRLAKKELAIALAEILHGSIENLIHVDLSFTDEIIHSKAIFDLKVWNDYNVAYRGKNVVDYIAEKLWKKPFSVLLLENVDKADLLVQNSLSKAVKTGRFSDSHGREFGIGNAIFVTTSESKDGEKTIYPGNIDYSEEDVLAARGLPIQMMIGFDLGDYATSQNSSMLDTTIEGSANRILINKRKLIGHRDIVKQCGSLEMAKRAHRASNTRLDLNFPAETGKIYNGSSGISESDSVSESCRTWLEDFLGQLDATVAFKPFDFDRIAQKILNDISECFQRIVCSECSLEIDSRVMVQMVAAACLIDNKKVEDWIQCVLSKGFEEAREKYSLTAHSTVKLVASERVLPEEQTQVDLLPSRVILN